MFFKDNILVDFFLNSSNGGKDGYDEEEPASKSIPLNQFGQ